MDETKTELDFLIRALVVANTYCSPLSSLGDRAKRRVDKLIPDITTRLEAGEDPGQGVVARLEEADPQVARNIQLGIQEYKKIAGSGEYEKLRECVERKRAENGRTLIYGLRPGQKIQEEQYLRFMQDLLGIDERQAASMYPHILKIAEILGKSSLYEEREKFVKVNPPKTRRTKKKN